MLFAQRMIIKNVIKCYWIFQFQTVKKKNALRSFMQGTWRNASTSELHWVSNKMKLQWFIIYDIVQAASEQSTMASQLAPPHITRAMRALIFRAVMLLHVGA